MSFSPLVPPFCAHPAATSAALLPSSPECPLTLTQRISNLRSAVACTSRRHTLTCFLRRIFSYLVNSSGSPSVQNCQMGVLFSFLAVGEDWRT
eukprot:COSAG06_NODE_147_length_22091_cov_70.669880_9_plen_93_part_00